MRILTFIISLICVLAFAQDKISKETLKIISKYPPPNGILLEKNLYMDETEIANIHYLEYLFRLKTDSSELVYNQALPYNHDLTWPLIPKDSFNIIKFYQEDRYLRYPGFRYFPVVGITKQQAIHYANWRSEIVTKTMNEKLTKEKKLFRINYKFRLPTEDEWETAAYGTLNSNLFPFGIQFTRVPTDKFWLKRFEQGEVVPDTALYLQFNSLEAPTEKRKRKFKTTEYVYAYRSNTFGFYNMIGNVAEMVADSNYTKGGSWVNSKEDCEIQDRIFYSCPTEWIGFRCICEVSVENTPLTIPEIRFLNVTTDTCKFIEKRKKADHIPNINKAYAAFTIKDNAAFNIKINDVIIFQNDTIRKRVDIKSKLFKKEGFEIKPVINDQLPYEFYKVELVAVNGPYVTSTEIKDKSGKMLISSADNLQSFDYIVLTIFRKEKGFGGFLISSVARKI